MAKLNQKGFSAIESLLILVIVAIIAGTGYYVYQANNKSNDALNNANLNAQSEVIHKKKTASQSALFVIKEWGVQGQIDKSVTPKYDVTSDKTGVWARLTSDQLVAFDANCDLDSGGVIVRAKGTDNLFSPDGADTGKTVAQSIKDGVLGKYKKVGDYYYWFEQSQVICSQKDGTGALQQKTYDAFSKAVSTFEATPQ